MATQFLSTEIASVSNKREILVNVAKTAITGKTLETALDAVAELCVSAVEKAGDAESVKVVSFPGGSLEDSYLYDGVIVNKDFVLEGEDVYGRMLLINTGLETEKAEDNVQVQLDAKSYQSFKGASKADLISSAKHIVNNLTHGGVVFVRDGVSDTVCTYLKKNSIMVVRRMPESVMRSLSRLSGIEIVQTPEEIEDVAEVSITRERKNDVWYLFVGDSDLGSEEATLVLRGATSHTLEEVERGFDDALGVVSLVMKSENYVVGGGNAYVRMATHLRQHAASVGGRAQMAIEAFADALEVIPATIAENAGHDPLDTILAMRHSILQGQVTVGPDVTEGGVRDLLADGVIEPVMLVRQAVLSAAEVTNAILRIDDIVARRPTQ
jgi:chaperonin GroEL (HSP60 family)